MVNYRSFKKFRGKLHVIDLIRAADLLELTSVKNETLKVIEEHISFDVSYVQMHRK